MKQKDIIAILVVSFVSLIISIFVSKLLFASSSQQDTVEVVPPISANFSTPSSQYFNSNSIDPTQLIQIGNTSNPSPFNNTSNQ